MKKNLSAILFITATLIFSLSACAGRTGFGQALPEDAPVIKLATILASPANYNTKEVMLEGVITGQCASLCEFSFQDGPHKAVIFPHGFSLPKLPVGRRVKVYALVTAGEGRTILSALGLELGK